jgi:molybdopterin-guanine dinucleotide biosynthesis protein A
MPSNQPIKTTKGTHNTLIGVVLAGGQSRRMGSDKALLPLQGQTLLQHQVELLARLCERVLVSGEYAGFDCVPDIAERCGPLGGIYAVAKQCPNAALLIIPVDMPQLIQTQLHALLQSKQSCFIEGHPLPAFFPHSGQLLPVISAILQDAHQDFSIWNLHRILNSKALPLADFNGLNINEPQQWQDFNLSLNKMP